MAIMGLDIGTTGSKAVVFDLDGKILSSSYREYNIISPRPGWVELSPNEVLAAVKNVVSEATAKSPDKVKAVALSLLGEAAVPVDRNFNPLANSIVGFDPRGEKQCRIFRTKIDPVEMFKITGHPANSYHTLFKLLYLKEEEPQLFNSAYKFLCYGDFVAARLGLEPTIDYSEASRTLMFDQNRLCWSEKIFDLAGMDMSIMAKTAAPGSAIGTIGKNDLGFPPGAVLATGLHDQPAGILGAGIEPGESMLATGTVVCMGVLLNQSVEPLTMIKNNLCRYPTFGGNFVSLCWNFTGGVALKWFRDNFAMDLVELAKTQGRDSYDLITAQMPKDPTKLILLPYFTTTGTPYLDTQASALIMGLNLNTTRFQIARAIMEGIAYELRLNQELLQEAGVQVKFYKAIGGAAKSDFWMQLYADILDRPISLLQTTECAAWGVALLAASAAGLLKDTPDEVAKKISTPGKQYTPREDQVKAYNDRLQIYRQIYPKNKDLIHQLAEL
ncbi:MAG: FGGY-family carbohydrate kinase [Phycisphaerae bacterium]